jgi:hypothetical protein
VAILSDRVDPRCRTLFESLPIAVKDEILESDADISTREKLNAVIMHHLYELHPDQRDEVMKSIHMTYKD